MISEVQTLPGALAELRAARPPRGRVLCAYLDTSPSRLAGQAYLLRFRDECKALRGTLPEEEREPFEAAAEQAEQALLGVAARGSAGVAIFASGEPQYLYTVPLPERPMDQVTWSATAELEPLQRIVDDYERLAVVLFDKERARVFTLFLGEIEEREEIQDEVPGKQATGGWFALAETRYARHHEDHVLRHVQHTTAVVMELLRRRPFDRLLLAGPDEALSLLLQHLPQPLHDRLAGTLRLEVFASEGEVRAAALAAAEQIERREEQRAVEELLDAPPHHAAVGIGATLAAMHEGRVHCLLLAESFAAIGAECTGCGRLTAGLGPCPACGGVPTPLGSLRERLLERALALGARVEIVSGDAAALLMTRDGVGAWTRF